MASLPVAALRSRFTAYVDTFAAASGRLPPMLQLKVEHSARVSRECRAVAAELGWPGVDLDLAEVAGLLHDLGRFEQCQRFGTFADQRSVDHGDLGVTVLDQAGFGDDLDADAGALVRAAIRCHNKQAVPAGLTPAAQALVQLVRDADKLDIMTIIESAIRSGAYQRDPAILLHVSPDGPPTAALVAEIRAGATGSYGQVHSLADIRLVGVSWTRDIVCEPVLRRLRQRGLTQGLAQELSNYAEVHALATALLREMDRRLAAVPAPGPALPGPSTVSR